MMRISIADPMTAMPEDQSIDGRCADACDDLRDLICRDKARRHRDGLNGGLLRCARPEVARLRTAFVSHATGLGHGPYS